MRSEGRKAMPAAVLRRLVRYLSLAQRLREQGREWVSSLAIAEELGLTSSTVRQDLLHLDFSGISKRGYRTEGLERAICEAIGADVRARLVIVGAGNLGRALAMHGGLPARGFDICGIFDSDPRLVGRRVGRTRVQGMDKMVAAVREQDVDIGVIAVPAHAAQDVADRLVYAGVRGLLNLAHVNLRAPPGVSVVDARLIASFQELWYAIQANPLSRKRRLSDMGSGPCLGARPAERSVVRSNAPCV